MPNQSTEEAYEELKKKAVINRLGKKPNFGKSIIIQDQMEVVMDGCPECKAKPTPIVTWGEFVQHEFLLLRKWCGRCIQDDVAVIARAQTIKTYCNNCGLGLNYCADKCLAGYPDVNLVDQDNPDAEFMFDLESSIAGEYERCVMIYEMRDSPIGRHWFTFDPTGRNIIIEEE